MRRRRMTEVRTVRKKKKKRKAKDREPYSSRKGGPTAEEELEDEFGNNKE